MRRAHRKSRLGCRVCKQRHIKCDESKPSCLNCLAVERRCSFLDNVSLPPAASAHSPRPSLPPSPPPTNNHDATPGPSLGEDYTITHLDLFHHFEHSLSHDLNPFKPDTDAMLNRTIKESFAFPFLMDELLALSAAHRSTLDTARKDTYLSEATRLQTRGLSRFNAVQTELSDENCVAVFMYSALLGLHVLFDTFSLRCDFDAVMAKFVQCLSLHRGLRIIASSSWTKIHSELLGGDESHLVPLEPVKPGDECGPVWALVEQSELNDEERQYYQDAIKALQSIFSRRRMEKTRGPLGIQEWAVRVPTGYIGLLSQKRPEAMVILAYYAVLLHRDRDCWAIGDTGAYLIRSVTRHLGAGWTRWLEWPNRILEECSSESSSSSALAL
ncbi:hypothetical protein VUR80DRAFT_5189 [Thermomyces stellatus]